MATAARPKAKQSRKQAIDELTALIVDHLAGLPEDEQSHRIARFRKRVGG